MGPEGPEGPRGASAGKIFYLAPSNPSDISGYKTLSESSSSGPEQQINTTVTGTFVETLIASFATEPGVPGALDLPGGTAYRRIYAAVSGGICYLRMKVYVRTAAGVETEVRNESSFQFSNTAGPGLVAWEADIAEGSAMAATDRLVCKLYALRHSGPTSIVVSTYYESPLRDSQVQTTISSGAQGPPGLTGPQGLSGTPTWRGVWSAASMYAAGDAVSFGADSFVANQSLTGAGQSPATFPSGWVLLAEGGTDWLSGAGDPEELGYVGDPGDFYFDTRNLVIYGPKVTGPTSDVWPRPGTALQSTTPVVRARRSSNAVLPNVYSGPHGFTIEDGDTDNYWNGTRFQPTKSGWYEVRAHLYIGMGSGQQGTVVLVKNHSGALPWAAANELGNANPPPPSGAASVVYDVSAVVFCNGTTDYVEVFSWMPDGSRTLYGSPSYTSYFEAQGVGVSGPPGPEGLGLPAGGSIGSILQKKSATNYDTEWLTPANAKQVQHGGTAVGAAFNNLTAALPAAGSRIDFTVTPGKYILFGGLSGYHSGAIAAGWGIYVKRPEDAAGIQQTPSVEWTINSGSYHLTAPPGAWEVTVTQAGTMSVWAAIGALAGSGAGDHMHMVCLPKDIVGPQGAAGAPGATGPPWVPTSYTLDTWHTVGAAGEPAYQPGSSANAEGGIQFRKSPDGKVLMRGVANTPAAVGSGIFQLPVGYRTPASGPAYNRFSCTNQANGAQAYIYVRQDGMVIKGGGETVVDLSPVEFDTDTVTTMLAGPKGDTGSQGPAGDAPAAHVLEGWHDVGAGSGLGTAFAGTWVNAAIADYPLLQFRKDPFGEVRVRGAISGGAAGTMSTVFTLPAGYRPALKKMYIDGVVGDGGAAANFVHVLPTGEFQVQKSGTYAFIDATFDSDTVTSFLAGPKGDKGDPGSGTQDGDIRTDLLKPGILGNSDFGGLTFTGNDASINSGFAYVKQPSDLLVKRYQYGRFWAGFLGTAAAQPYMKCITLKADGEYEILTGTPTAGCTLDTRYGYPTIPATSILLWDVLVTAAGANGGTRDRRPWARGVRSYREIPLGSPAFYPGPDGNNYPVRGPAGAVGPSIPGGASITQRVECSGGRSLRITFTYMGWSSGGASVYNHTDYLYINGTNTGMMRSSLDYTSMYTSRHFEWFVQPSQPSSLLIDIYSTGIVGAGHWFATAYQSVGLLIEEMELRAGFANNGVV